MLSLEVEYHIELRASRQLSPFDAGETNLWCGIPLCARDLSLHALFAGAIGAEMNRSAYVTVIVVPMRITTSARHREGN